MPTIPYDTTRVSLFSPGDAPTLFTANQALTPVQTAIEAARLAYIRAETSTAEGRRLAASLALAGFERLRTFNDAAVDAQGFAAYRGADKTALVAFRGTEPAALKDLLGDAELNLVRWSGAGRVHSGFVKRAMALLPKIRDWLATEAADRQSLLLAGHSLGGAMALLSAGALQSSQVVTLGCPQAGNGEFAASMQGVKCLRIVNCVDLVTFLPLPIDTPLYSHVGKRVYVTRDGVAGDPADDAFVAEDRVKAAAGYRLNYPTAELPRTLADHAPINYLRAFY